MKKIDRIIKYVESQGLSMSDFERRAGFSNAYLLNTKKRDSDLSNKSLIKLKENLPDDYYKIFPEEKEGFMEEHEPGYSVRVLEPEVKWAESKLEIEYLKSLLESKEREIESLKMVIDVLKKLNAESKSQEERKHSA